MKPLQFSLKPPVNILTFYKVIPVVFTGLKNDIFHDLNLFIALIN